MKARTSKGIEVRCSDCVVRFSYRHLKRLLRGRVSDVLSSNVADAPEDAGANNLGLNRMNRKAIGVPIPQLQNHFIGGRESKANTAMFIQKRSRERDEVWIIRERVKISRNRRSITAIRLALAFHEKASCPFVLDISTKTWPSG